MRNESERARECSSVHSTASECTMVSVVCYVFCNKQLHLHHLVGLSGVSKRKRQFKILFILHTTTSVLRAREVGVSLFGERESSFFRE